MNEIDNEIGSGFSVEVCKKWEESFFEIATLKTRKVAIRSSMVFGKGGSVYDTMQKLAKLHLAGTQGNGKQYVSWIHIQDFIQAILFIQNNKQIKGFVNVCAPTPLPNSDFQKKLRRSLNISWGLPANNWMVKIGAYFMRTEAELVLKSRRVIPQTLLIQGFEFKFNKIEECFEDLAR